MTQPTHVIRTIHDIRIGDAVRSLMDGSLGEAVDVDGACIKVRWDDDTHSIYHKRDGFVLFTPTTGPAAA
jgi:hypothetical protein